MIEKNNREYTLQCDFCSNCIEELEDFQEAVNYKKANKWKSVKVKEEWFDKCPNCITKEE